MKALVGSWEHRPYRLLAEVTALRTRVRDLEQALNEEREGNAALREQLAALQNREADREVVLSSR